MLEGAAGSAASLEEVASAVGMAVGTITVSAGGPVAVPCAAVPAPVFKKVLLRVAVV